MNRICDHASKTSESEMTDEPHYGRAENLLMRFGTDGADQDRHGVRQDPFVGVGAAV
jgi:hypothetical protein